MSEILNKFQGKELDNTTLFEAYGAVSKSPLRFFPEFYYLHIYCSTLDDEYTFFSKIIQSTT
jgi:hypothetical protein